MIKNSKAMLTQAEKKDRFHRLKVKVTELFTWVNSVEHDAISETIINGTGLSGIQHDD